ncbi:MAG TPA: glycosyltransferase, partial [Gemmatimonadales bacterium]|nr:glycosyltransferase [Gemmatimonadales bacterium]
LGIAAAHGELIAFLDADDSWEPNHLAEVVPLLEENPIAALAFSRERRFGGWGGTHPRVLQPGRPVDGFWPVLRKNFVPQMGAVVRRDALIEVQGYDETMRYAEDYDLWLRLARRFPMICTDRVTCNHRGHPDQASARDDLLARGAYEARWHAWCAARVTDSPRVVQRIERIIRAAWNDYLWKVWRSRNRSLMAAALSLRQFVPGSHSIYRRWDRRARLLWPWYLRAARGWDRVVGNEKRETGSEKRA